MTIGCQNISVPKPKAFLKLEYPIAKYQKVKPKLPLSFDKNEISSIKIVQNNNRVEGINLEYKPLKAVVYISYKTVEKNLEDLIKSSVAITQQHAKIAHSISEKEFSDDMNNIYGKIYDLSGPVASQIQFYVTDKSKHFLSGTVYFNIKPNYDSIFPAVRYLQADVVRLMESLEWTQLP